MKTKGLRTLLALIACALFLVIWLSHFISFASFPVLVNLITEYRGIQSYMGEYTSIAVLMLLMAVVSGVTINEKRTNNRVAKSIPIRIHVGGIRGKSTVTRLMGAALRESGMRVITKTTGKAARLIDLDGEETVIERKVHLPNIQEQLGIVSYTGDVKADALVVECMAVRPDLAAAEKKMIQPTISIITNVRTDHLDALGPTLEDVAKNLCQIIPKNGLIVTAEEKHLDIIQSKANEVGAQVICADPNSVPDNYVQQFSYLNFEENIATVLAVCKLIGVNKDVALRGMLKAKPDPGILKLFNVILEGKQVRFINAFGVNDVDSTTQVYKELQSRGCIGSEIIGVFHARGDRVTRTVDFGRAMARDMRFDKILVFGRMTTLFINEATKLGYPRKKITNLGNTDLDKVKEAMLKLTGSDVIFFGCGNMVGIEALIERFETASPILEKETKEEIFVNYV